MLTQIAEKVKQPSLSNKKEYKLISLNISLKTANELEKATNALTTIIQIAKQTTPDANSKYIKENTPNKLCEKNGSKLDSQQMKRYLMGLLENCKKSRMINSGLPRISGKYECKLNN